MFHDSDDSTFEITWPGFGPSDGQKGFGVTWNGLSPKWLREFQPSPLSPYTVTLQGDIFDLEFSAPWTDLSLIYQSDPAQFPFSLNPAITQLWTFDESTGLFSPNGQEGSLLLKWGTPSEGGLLIVGTIDLGGEIA